MEAGAGGRTLRVELTGEGSTTRPTASTGGPSTSSSMERLYMRSTKPPKRKFHKLRRSGMPNSCFIRSYEWNIWESRIGPVQLSLTGRRRRFRTETEWEAWLACMKTRCRAVTANTNRPTKRVSVGGGRSTVYLHPPKPNG